MMNEQLINILGIASLLAIIALVMVLFQKMGIIKQLQFAVNKLKGALDEMDEQAKLIVRTDIELNKIQEELDKKVTGLYALQKISRSISTTLEENQIFKMIEPAFLEELGFSKACIFLLNADAFLLRLNIGYAQDEIGEIKTYLDSEKPLYLDLIRETKTLSSISTSVDSAIKQKINSVFKVDSFIISPILSKEGSKGFLFVGAKAADSTITEGDQELMLILTNQVSQAMDNARLFEKTWRTQQELENKVEKRTHELTRLLDEVKSVSKRKSEFISAVSHELRTPLTSVKGYASILLTEKLGKLPPEIRERLEKINKHSDELVHMVNDLLDIARIESGRMALKFEALDLKELLDKVIDLLSVQLKEKNIETSLNLADNARSIFADRSQIERVFINIIGNAIKFTPNKGRISVRASQTEKIVWVDIIDTGCGIPEEAQEKIFDEFYRVDNLINQEVKGTGLGLSLVKHIIEAHRGKIWVKSKAGQGSTFSFTLPQSA